MPDTISPVTREEDYLAAIAGQDVTPPTPVTRKEEWLDLIAGKVDDLAGDLSTAEGEIDDLQDIVPTPEAADSGKVLTAGADGTASWQTASGGGGGVVIKFTGTATYSAQDASWECGVDKTAAEIEACFSASTAAPLYLLLPDLTTDSPYYDYSLPTANKLLPAYNLGGSNQAPRLEWGLSKVDDDYIVWVEMSTD